ncbi:MAG: ABC transporter permease [Actinobacteria bacterium]|nr:ABC transporter permease [Actinomycetota bacterium]
MKPFNNAHLGFAWATSLLRRRTGRLIATALGVALAVGLFASLGAFVSASKATMTSRAIEGVAVDWQIEAQTGAQPADMAAVIQADPHITSHETVELGQTTGFESHHGNTTQTTGAGVVLGMSSTYRTTFPDQFRDLAGSTEGVLLFQQTAANLAAQPGDSITIGRPGMDAATLTVDGVVDIPQADSLFQAVGAPPNAQPQAPPDNVVILPIDLWHQVFDPLQQTRPDLITQQVHARIDHYLPGDPSAAYNAVSGQARNLEVHLAGSGLVGDNVGAALASARTDALYAQVLFLFLGTPGAVLAGLLTATVAASGRTRRRREQALLRTRGATTRQLVILGGIEAALVAVLGSALGLGLAQLVGRAAFGTSRFGATNTAELVWSVAAILSGFVIALMATAVPAFRDAHNTTVASARLLVGRATTPMWMRWRVDYVLLIAAVVVFWMTSRTGYKLVLAVEGVPTISVSYWAFAGPALLWIGAGLLAYRLTDVGLRRGRPPLRTVLQPVSGALSDTVAASLIRQRRLVAKAAALIALTVGFAASTAVFNATYRQQAEVDAVLTNGADVTVTTSPGSDIPPDGSIAQSIESTAGVHHVEAIQHRFAYVGSDLQDLYGVNPDTIVAAGRLQNGYFEGGTANGLIAELAAHPDSVLVSAETVRDFQLLPGDQITLRLQDGATKEYVDVPFHYAGVVKEFPTAPSDSFLLANADYVAQQTGTDTVGAFLLDTGGSNVTGIADHLRSALGTSATVTDIESSRRIIGSSLTAVDLAGLTRVELGFALALAAAATGLTLWLGLNERRRTYAIATALGATPRQLASFVWAEAVVVTGAGMLSGSVIAWALSHMLVKVLHGVFDPAPEHLAIPGGYLGAVGLIAIASTIAAAVAAIRAARTSHIELLRTV